ncbi:MAG TPA: porin [Roseiarcus sp.]|nr:porin [Roseiarcus sp.]
MTLMKSLLLGSAAGFFAVASAQAADLPTRKGPVAAEYVRVCSITVAGAPVVGFVLPGSDTCLKISGYITGQIEGGNLKQGYSYAPAFSSLQALNAPVRSRDSIGWTTRYNLTLDAVSNTAYGPLVAHGEYQFNYGQGFDTTGATGSDGGLNQAYVTWAGITAGKIASFFSFTGGGYGWANFFSPDRKGYNQPDVLAYTASFGGGFAATISLESSQAATSGPITWAGGSETGYLGSALQDGHRVPDIVGALSVHQAWGSAQISGVAHNVRATSVLDGSSIDKWGWAVDAGVSFNIPSFAGASIGVTGAWSQNAAWYSGIPDAMWGEDGATNGNGQAMAIGDAFSNGDGTWAKPTDWSVTGYAQFAVNPQITLQIEGSYGEVHWDDRSAIGLNLYDSKSYLIGGLIHYDPVKNLDFALETMYQSTTSDQPGLYTPGGAGFTSSWQGKGDGFAARLMITRSF